MHCFRVTLLMLAKTTPNHGIALWPKPTLFTLRKLPSELMAHGHCIIEATSSVKQARGDSSRQSCHVTCLPSFQLASSFAHNLATYHQLVTHRKFCVHIDFPVGVSDVLVVTWPNGANRRYSSSCSLPRDFCECIFFQLMSHSQT